MSTTIERLELKVQSNSTSAVGGIDALSESLRRLKAATAPVSKGGVGLGALSNSLEKFSSSVSGLTGLSLAKKQVQKLVGALKPLESVQKSGFNSLASGLEKLVKIAPQIDTVTESLKKTDLDSFADQCNRVAAAITPLATQMEKVAAGFSAFPAKTQRLLKGNTSLAASNTTLGKSYVNLAAKISLAYIAMQRIARVIAGWISKSNQYIESMNLVSVSLGEYADEAQKYAEKVGDAVGIDPAEWLKNQGVFNTLIEGFGVSGDRAAYMSQQLTQLGYDITSFYGEAMDMSLEEAMQKLQSGIAGELEPLRRLGYDLSVARLQQEAYTLGIEKSVNAMTQGEKAELRYYAIMTQITDAHGDMARTIQSPANQLRILRMQVEQCARAFGNIFLPILQAILPPLIAVAKIVRLIAEMFARIFGIEITDFGGISESVGGAAGGASDLEDNLGNAAKKAKEVKNALLGIDELNIISPPDDTDSGNSALDGIGGGGLGIELPGYNFLEQLANGPIDELVQKMKEWLGITEDIDTWAELFDTRLGKILSTVATIGTAFAAWKIAQGLITFLDKLKGFAELGVGGGLLGFLMLASDLNEFIKYLQDFLENGATFQNVVGMISEFAGAIGDCAIMLGNIKLGAALKIVQGIGEIVIAVKDISESGVNWDNATTAVRGLTNLAIGIGLFTGNLKVAAWGVAIQGFTSIIEEIANNWEAIKQGDWSGVDKTTIIIGGLQLLGGLAVALDVFSKLKSVLNIGKNAKAVETVSTAVGGLDTTISTGLSPKLTSLAKNLGVGLVIIAEIAAAALLIVGAIALMGMGLEQVGIAWEPVIANGETIAVAIGIGIGALVVVGVAVALLGSVGTPLIVNIAIGTAILAELGVATGLFLVEIWAIGKGLVEIGKAWQPVLDNGETIATAIGVGTGLLIGIGVVTAALGVATVASAGLLPLAIGLGTALLVELTAALILFIESLVAVADELGNNLSPALEDLNGKLPDLTTNMSNFVDFMCAFAGEVVRYSGASTIAGLSATIDTIIGWFTQDPIEKMSNDVDNVANQASDLNDKLNIAIPELETAIDLLNKYVDFIDELGTIAGSGGTVNLSEGLKVNLRTVGENIVTGFNEGVRNKYSTIQSTITTWGTDVQKWFTNSSYGGINRETFQNYGKDIINGFNTGITNNYSTAKSGMTSFANTVKKAFTEIVSYNTFKDIAKDVIDGFNKGINDFYDTTAPYMRKWANAAKNAYKAALDSNSPSKVFMRIGEDTVLGYNLGISNLGSTTKDVVNTWAKSFTSVSPVMRFAVDTSALKYYTSDSFSKSVSADVVNNRNFSVTGFKEGMEEFYHEYIEPTMAQMAEDMRRQADKEEQTIVQIGNRTVNDAVTTQRKANGYVFVK